MPSDPPLPPAPERPSPRFTKISWAVMLGGLLITFCVYQVIYNFFRRPGDWFPGLGEAILGLAITAVASFGCGLTALIRRERKWGFALVPFLAGLGAILYALGNILFRH